MKKQNSVIFSALFFLAAILAETYSFSRFREDVIVIAGVSAVVLIAAYIFFDGLYSTYLLHREAEKSEREEQDKQLLEALDKQLLEAGRIQKALFAAAKGNGRLLEEGLRSAETRDRENSERMAENLDRAARLISKFNRDDLKRVAALEKKYTDDILKALSEGSSRIAEQLSDMDSLSGEKAGDSRDVAAITECINRNFESVKIKIEGGFELMEGNLSEIRDHLVEFKLQADRNEGAFREAAASQNSLPDALPAADFPNPEHGSEAVEAPGDAVPDDVTSGIDAIPDMDIPDDVIPDIDAIPDMDIPDDVIPDIDAIPDMDIPDDVIPDIDAIPDMDIPDDVTSGIDAIPDMDVPDDVMQTGADITDMEAVMTKTDPNRQINQDEIAALFAAADGAPRETAPSPVPDKPQASVPLADDANPNRQMSPDEIAALFAAADDAPRETAPSPVPDKPQASVPLADDANPNRQMSPDEIAALFAAADAGEKMPEVEKKAPEPSPPDTNEDANKQMTPEQIAALIASMGK